MTINIVRRRLLVVSAVGGLMLAGVPLASTATLPAAVAAPSPGGLPIVGALIDSVVGIVTGTTYGIGGAASAVLCPLGSPVCGTVPIPGH
jgi:hypothetical protein